MQSLMHGIFYFQQVINIAYFTFTTLQKLGFKNSNIVEYYCSLKLLFNIHVFCSNVFWNDFYSCDGKSEFSTHSSSLECHMILKTSF